MNYYILRPVVLATKAVQIAIALCRIYIGFAYHFAFQAAQDQGCAIAAFHVFDLMMMMNEYDICATKHPWNNKLNVL